MNLLLSRRARVSALVLCTLGTYGCQSGLHNSVAPSAISSVSGSAGSSSAVVTPGDAITTQDAPVSFALSEQIINGFPSGYTGTCTVANTHSGGIRVKVDGQGVANTVIKLHVVDVTDPLLVRTTEWVDVNQQGAFRTNWQLIDSGVFAPADNLQCWLMSGSDVLASSSNFPAP